MSVHNRNFRLYEFSTDAKNKGVSALAKKGAKKVITEEQRREDVIGSRLMALLIVSIVYIFILMGIHNTITGITNILTGFTVIKVMFYVSIGLLVLSAIFFAVRRVKKVDESLKVFTGTNVFATFIVFCVASFFIYKFDVHAIKFMYVLIPVWFLIYMIYKLYMREFFTLSLSCAVGGIGLYGMYRLCHGAAGGLFSASGVANIIMLIVMVLLSVLVCVLCVNAKKNNGRLSKSEKAIHLAAVNAKYQPLFVAPIIVVVCLIVSIFFSKALLFGMFALIAYWFVMFIYYTYTMMKK